MSKRARSKHAAIKRYRRSLQRALSCLTATDIWISGEPDGGDEYRLALPGGNPILLDCGDRGLFFDASQRFAVYHDGDEFRVRTRGYIYTISESEALDTEIIGWHWHPATNSRPHLHVGGSALGHVPTGRVTFEAVARYLLEDLDASPAKDDWDDVLLATEALHVKYRSWSVDPHVDPQAT